MKSICETCGKCDGTQFRRCATWGPWWRKRWGKLMTPAEIRAREARKEHLQQMVKDAGWG